MTTKNVCKIKPIRAIVGYKDLVFEKPCGVRYLEDMEVYCDKWLNNECEYK